jgi:hypothetical protein
MFTLTYTKTRYSLQSTPNHIITNVVHKTAYEAAKQYKFQATTVLPTTGSTQLQHTRSFTVGMTTVTVGVTTVTVGMTTVTVGMTTVTVGMTSPCGYVKSVCV